MNNVVVFIVIVNKSNIMKTIKLRQNNQNLPEYMREVLDLKSASGDTLNIAFNKIEIYHAPVYIFINLASSFYIFSLMISFKLIVSILITSLQCSRTSMNCFSMYITVFF